MDWKFNSRGLIEPPERIEITFKDFQLYFDLDFPNSQTRSDLMNGYIAYNQSLKKEITANFTQWIGGSYTTNKLNPKDIDLLTILPYETYDKHEQLIEKVFRKSAKLEYGLDAYFIAFYPPEHQKFEIYKGEFLYWDHQFSRTRKNRAGKKFKRGYIQINS